MEMCKSENSRKFLLWLSGLRGHLQQLGWLWRRKFEPWPGNLHMLQVQPLKKKKKDGVPVVTQWKRIGLGTKRLQV